MSLFHVVNYDTYKVHYGRAINEATAKTMAPEDVTAENWWFWRTLCGVDLIGRVPTWAHEVNCAKCVKAYEAGERKAAELIGRFG